MTKGIDAWPGGVLRIRVPLPFPLRWTNAYALKDTRGWTVIDPGIHTDKAIQAWKEFLEMTNSRWQDVHRIVLTHHHPDHYGLSGWMQAQSGAEVLMSRKAYEQTRLFWGEERTMTDRMCALFAEHGLDNELLPRMHEHLESFVPQVTPAPEVTFIEAGERIMLGGKPYAAIETPGHAAGHLSFFDEQEGFLFCGDHVLSRITPNVSYLPGIDENPLQSYLQSLRMMQQYPVTFAFPGHRHPFASYRERIGEILLHHEQRLEQIRMLLNRPATAYELCIELFGTRLSLHQLRFALAETLAHLTYMEKEGRFNVDAGDVRRWRALSSL